MEHKAQQQLKFAVTVSTNLICPAEDVENH